MLEMRNGETFLRLREDLEYLEYGNSGKTWSTGKPFRFSWDGGVTISAADIRKKQVRVSENEIGIDLAGFVFAARFPGNSYCRPAPEYTPDLGMHLSLCLDGDDLVIRASPMEHVGSLHMHVMLAQGLMQVSTEEKAEVYIPSDYGMRFDCPRRDIWSRSFEPSAAWSLPVHGVFTPEGGLGMWCEDPDRDYVMACNTGREPALSLICREIYDDMANEKREIRFMLFGPGENFRSLALRCRELRKKTGRFVTLCEKAEKRPVAAQLPGTVFWKHNVYFDHRPPGVNRTYSLYTAGPEWHENEGMPGNWTAEEVFETARERGFDRVTVCNTGWNRDGFDAGYPARFPVSAERGGEEGFRRASGMAQAMSPGYFLNVHDNYQDAYETDAFDAGEMVQPYPGTPLRGGVWRGGQAYVMCSANGLRYARRDIPRLAEISGKGCMYIDVFANCPLLCCRAPGHMQTRRQDWMSKREICAVALQYVGALAVEGCGTDLYADLIDIGAYGNLHFGQFPPRSDGPHPVPVPLWQMVYHDCVLNYFGEGYSPVHGSEYRLYQALYTLLPTSSDDHAKRISFELRSAFTAAMTDFEDLVPRWVSVDPDGSFHTHGVARSRYENGTQVIANFEDTPFAWAGHEIPPRDFLVLGTEA